MGSDSLIKLTKARAKEIVLKNMAAYIPPKVFGETITIPKEDGYPDAFLIEENLRKGLLEVGIIEEKGDVEQMIERLGIKGGEADVFRMCFVVLRISNLPLGVWIFKKEKKFIFIAPVLASMRSLAGTLGVWVYSQLFSITRKH